MSESIDGPSPLGLVHDALTAVATMVTHGPALRDQVPTARDGHRSEAQAAVGTAVLAELAQLARLLAPAATVAAGSPSADVAHHVQALGAALDAHQAAMHTS